LRCDVEKSFVNVGIPEFQEKVVCNGIFIGSQLRQSDVGIPASGSVR